MNDNSIIRHPPNSFELLSTVLENLPIGVFMVEAPSGKPLFINRLGTELLGQGLSPDAHANNLSQVYAAFRQSTNIPYPTSEMPITLGLKGESVTIDDMEVHRPDGSKVLLEISGNPIFDREGKLIYSLVAFQDITNKNLAQDYLKKSEELLRNLISNSLDVIVLYDRNGKEKFISQSAYSICGYTADELMKIGGISIVHPDDVPLLLSTLEKAIRGSSKTGVITFRLQHKNGTWIHLEAKAANMLDVEGIAGIVGSFRDVTTRIEAEEIAKRNAADLDRVFQSVQAAIFIVEVIEESTFVYRNNNNYHYHVTGLESFVLSGKQPVEVFGEEIGNRHIADYLRCIELKTSITYDEEHELPVGKSYWRTTLSPVIENNKVTFIIGSSTDITQYQEARLAKEKAQTELFESERKYRGLFESIIDGVAYADLNGNILEANNAYLEMLGYNSLEEIKLNYHDITPEKWRDFEAGIIKDSILNRGYSDEYEKEYIRKDGTVFPVSLRVWLVKDQAGKPAGLWGIIRDISERKQAEELVLQQSKYLEALKETTPDGLWVVNPARKIIEVNEVACKISGYSREKLLQMEINELDAIESPKETEKRIERIIKNGAELFETRHRCKNGSVIDIEISASYLRINGGLIVSFFRDITARKQAENKLKQTLNELEQFNQYQLNAREEERAAIASAIHDEVGQAMTAIKIDLGWLRRTGENTAETNERIDKMHAVIDDSIKLAQRISSDLRPGILIDLGLVPALHWYCNEFSNRTGIKIDTNINYQIETNSKLDLALYRILQEALTNVIRHARATKVMVHLHHTDLKVRMVIEDDGIGMDNKELESSSSFGLIGMRERAHYFNGEIKINSMTGRGTQIIIIMPVNTK